VKNVQTFTWKKSRPILNYLAVSDFNRTFANNKKLNNKSKTKQQC